MKGSARVLAGGVAALVQASALARAGCAAALVGLAVGGCHRDEPAAVDAAAPSGSSTEVRVASGRVAALIVAEHRRLAADVTEADQQDRDVVVRRTAARALARIGGEGARAGLLRALADEDAEVVAWGAYGLGFSCKGHEAENVSALVAAALARSGGTQGPTAPGAIDPAAAFARAVGSCAAEASEPTLVAWLAGPRDRAVHAAYGLGDLASSKDKLREETIVALLQLAAGSASAPPMPEALFAIGRLQHVPPTVIDRIREVAVARLVEPGPARLFAVKALAHGGPDAAIELGRVLATAGTFSASERAEAARALKRLGRAGDRALAEAIPSLMPPHDPVGLTGLVSEDLGVLLTALASLQAPGVARASLRELAELGPPPGAPASILRRIGWIRCSAATVLADKNERDPLLLRCDTSADEGAKEAAGAQQATDAGAKEAPGATGPGAVVHGSIGQRAVVQVLGRGRLTGARLAMYKAYAEGGDLRAREAAIELLKTHDEVSGASALLAKALADPQMGLAATAAEIITEQPQRAREESKPVKGRARKRKQEDGEATQIFAPSQAVVDALLAALSSPAAADDLETLSDLVDAAGALALEQTRPKLEELCRSSYPVAREHAARSLALLGGKKVTCDAPAAGGEAPAEIAALPAGPVTLSFDTDAGALTVTLDPSIAPVTAARIAGLARSGYYEGNIVHRVVAGFVTQFGAPNGDGFGGPPGPSLRCETSPIGFASMTVGVALAGRDTGSSQLFIMHAGAPNLDGRYAWIGTATGPWAALVDGDRIRKVTVSP